MMPAIISLLLIIHVCLVIVTGRSTFYWLARVGDALEAAQRATFICAGPWWRIWRRQCGIEWRLRDDPAATYEW